MPKIGMRIIKSSVAVFLCFVIYLIRGEGIPFYSAIAAVLCMQPYVSNGRKVAINRIIGTFIGGICGMFVMLIEKQFIPLEVPVLKYLLISAVIIPLIYFTVLIKKTTASYITVVVFLCITVSHGLDANPYLFTMNRVIDTLIGIFVSLGVNVFHFPRRKNSRLLFVSDLDGLVDSEGQVSSYSKIKLNQLIQKGALITVASRLSSASAAPVLNDININIPIITLDGAAMYDLAAKTYLYCKFITYPDAAEILDVFDKYGLNCFVYTVINDFLHIYYGDFTNPAEEKMYHANKLHPLKNYVYSRLPENRDVVYFRAVDTPDMIKKLYRDLLRLKCSDRINITYRKDESSEHYCFLEIYSAEASKANAVFELGKRLNADRTAAFGCCGGDIEMINNADYGYAVRNASEDLLEMAPNIIGDGGSDSVVKMIEKLFYSKKLI